MKDVETTRFQFSLANLLLSMTVIAAGLAAVATGIRNGYPFSIIAGVLLASWAVSALIVPRGSALRLIAFLALCLLLCVILFLLFGPRVE